MMAKVGYTLLFNDLTGLDYTVIGCQGEMSVKLYCSYS